MSRGLLEFFARSVGDLESPLPSVPLSPEDDRFKCIRSILSVTSALGLRSVHAGRSNSLGSSSLGSSFGSTR